MHWLSYPTLAYNCLAIFLHRPTINVLVHLAYTWLICSTLDSVILMTASWYFPKITLPSAGRQLSWFLLFAPFLRHTLLWTAPDILSSIVLYAFIFTFTYFIFTTCSVILSCFFLLLSFFLAPEVFTLQVGRDWGGVATRHYLQMQGALLDSSSWSWQI